MTRYGTFPTYQDCQAWGNLGKAYGWWYDYACLPNIGKIELWVARP
ncbi:hypothetical protein [Pseudonocardia sp. GCM10023141]